MKNLILIGGLTTLTGCLSFGPTQTKHQNLNGLKQTLNYCSQLCKNNVNDFHYEEFKDGNSINAKCNCQKNNKEIK